MADQEQHLSAAEPSRGLARDVPDVAEAIRGLLDLAARFVRAIAEAADRADRAHDRAQRLEAYRRRREWKQSDIPRLESLGVNAAARSRMERLPSLRGRPTIRAHSPLAEVILAKAGALGSMYDPLGTPASRLKALKAFPWWMHHAEALYRGVHEEARRRCLPGPADHAERVVGRALGISPSSLRSLCGAVRAMRARDEACANFPAVTMAQYEEWLLTGKGVGGTG